jgi:hypothetical protein
MIPLFIYTYIRLACYAVVVASALASMGRKRFSKLVLVADITYALLAALALYFKGTLFLGLSTQDFFLTPAVVIWAILHFRNLLKG